MADKCITMSGTTPSGAVKIKIQIYHVENKYFCLKYALLYIYWRIQRKTVSRVYHSLITQRQMVSYQHVQVYVPAHTM